MNEEFDLYKYPRNFFVNITGRCNLKCIYCSSADFNNSYDMKREELKYIIAQLEKHGALKIVITGGEPLLHPDFDWALSKFTRFSTVSVNTNGIFLKDHMKFLEKFEFKKRISFNVSLDSLDGEKNSRTRGNYDIVSILKNVKYLSDIGYNLSILCTVTRFFDEDDIASLKVFSQNNKDIGVSLNDLKLTGRASDPMSNLLPDLKTIKMINSKYGTFQNYNYECQECNSDISQLITCGAGKECLSISESGDVFPCTAMYIKIGNIFEKTIKEMCDTSEIIQELKSMRYKKIDSINECEQCEFVNKCDGGCRANAYIATGNLYGVDPYCWHKGKYFKESIV